MTVELIEGYSYTAKVTVTNRTRKGTTPIPASLNVWFAWQIAEPGSTWYNRVEHDQWRDFDAGETHTFEFDISPPVGYRDQTGIIEAAVRVLKEGQWVPVADASLDMEIIAVTADLAALQEIYGGKGTVGDCLSVTYVPQAGGCAGTTLKVWCRGIVIPYYSDCPQDIRSEVYNYLEAGILAKYGQIDQYQITSISLSSGKMSFNDYYSFWTGQWAYFQWPTKCWPSKETVASYYGLTLDDIYPSGPF